MKNYVSGLTVLLIALVSTTALSQSSKPPKLKSFEFLGCSGDWDGKMTKPEIWRVAKDGSVTFLTHHVATCGLSGRNARVTGDSQALNLSYELHSPSEAVVMCDCEYWTKFTFGADAQSVRSVSLNGEQSLLVGEW